MLGGFTWSDMSSGIWAGPERGDLRYLAMDAIELFVPVRTLENLLRRLLKTSSISIANEIN